MKAIVVVIAFTLLVGCQTLGKNPYVATASVQDIETAKMQFKEHKEVNVSDDGVIKITNKLPSRYVWERITIREFGHRLACEKLIDYIEAGFVVQFVAQGKGGANKFYNKEYCDTEETTDIFKDGLN
ncbi:hypothetical protein [Aliivibrio kagoshimensis]|uniref:hypothetical protein n=1 Tax=Aliivibrio kagoshimensis TaxID=2910230 RepID=UPI003D13E236